MTFSRHEKFSALNIAEQELGDNHRWKIYVKVQIAYWYKQNRKMVEAEAWKKQALQMSDARGLSDHQPPKKCLLEKI